MDWPRLPNGTAKSGVINGEEGIRYQLSFTLTSTSGHTDVPFQWFDKVGKFAHAFCHRAAIGLERGGVRRVLHVQAVFEIGLAHRGDASRVAKVMREKIRKLCGLVGAKVMVKELAPSQSFEREYFVFVLSMSCRTLRFVGAIFVLFSRYP